MKEIKAFLAINPKKQCIAEGVAHSSPQSTLFGSDDFFPVVIQLLDPGRCVTEMIVVVTYPVCKTRPACSRLARTSLF